MRNYRKKNNQSVDFRVNRNDFNGYDQKQLYIKKGRCGNIKDDILNSGFITNKQFKKQIMFKAQKYIKTKRAKRKVCKYKEERGDVWIGVIELRNLCYGINYGDIMTIQHLVAIICYTDYDRLQTAWTATFRNKHFGESLASIKQRNQHYYNLSKSLAEAVQCFGNQCMTYLDGWSHLEYTEQSGPFYCGMSSIMPLSSFNLRLQSPTSTTLHREVAVRFAKESGIMIKVNNNELNINKRCAFLNTSWISRFPEEDERCK